MAKAREASGQVIDESTEKRGSLVDDAYLAMRDAIRGASFAPGYQASEQEIASRLGMSRTPVHEAAIRLQEDGLVRVLPRRGILILAVSPNDVREIYDVIIAVEARAAELLAELPEVERESAAAELAQHTEWMVRADREGDLSGWGLKDAAFHKALVERAGNARMVRVIQTVNEQAHRVRMLTLKLRRGLETSIGEHRAIIDAIVDGDAERARSAASRHRLRARNELLPLLESLGLRHL